MPYRSNTDVAEAVFYHSLDAILLADDAGRYVAVNPAACAMTGYSRDELLGLSVWDLTRDIDQALAREQWRAVIERGTMTGEYTIQRKDGENVTVEFLAVARVSPGLHLSTLRDITERKRVALERERLLVLEQLARTEAEAASRTKDDFLAVLSHELRTPLNAILGWTHMMRTGTLPPERLAQGLEIVERNAQLQVRLVEGLLDLSSLAAGKLKIEQAPVALAPLVNAAVESMRHEARARRIALTLDNDAGSAVVCGDHSRLLQVLQNLLGNALKFTPAEGVVHVTVAADDRTCEIRVADSGVGIAQEAQPRVFDRFWQADSSPRRLHGGLGLGLAIVSELVRAHGGTVEAQSEGPRRGSTFVVRLPRAAERSTSA